MYFPQPDLFAAVLHVEQHEAEDSDDRYEDRQQAEQGDLFRKKGFFPIQVADRLIHENDVLSPVSDVEFPARFPDVPDDGRQIASVDFHVNDVQRNAVIDSEQAKGGRFDRVLQRLVVEVPDNPCDVVPGGETVDRAVRFYAVFSFGRLIENERIVFFQTVGFPEVAPFGNLHSHERQEIGRYAIDAEFACSIFVNGRKPHRRGAVDELAEREGDVSDGGMAFQHAGVCVRLFARFRRYGRYQDVLLPEAEIVAFQKPVLPVNEQGRCDKADSDHELCCNQHGAQPFPGTGISEISLDREGRIERGAVKSRVKSRKYPGCRSGGQRDPDRSRILARRSDSVQQIRRQRRQPLYDAQRQ